MRVIAVLQAKGQKPVEMLLARDTDALGAVGALTSQLQIDADYDDEFRALMPTLLSVRVEVTPEVPTEQVAEQPWSVMLGMAQDHLQFAVRALAAESEANFKYHLAQADALVTVVYRGAQEM